MAVKGTETLITMELLIMLLYAAVTAKFPCS